MGPQLNFGHQALAVPGTALFQGSLIGLSLWVHIKEQASTTCVQGLLVGTLESKGATARKKFLVFLGNLKSHHSYNFYL